MIWDGHRLNIIKILPTTLVLSEENTIFETGSNDVNLAEEGCKLFLLFK